MDEPLLKKFKLKESCDKVDICKDSEEHVSVISKDGHTNGAKIALSEINDSNNLLNLCRRNEEKVGMLSFVNKACQFSGVIKQRFADFMVRECDLEGNLVYLKTLDHCDYNIFDEKSTQHMVPVSDADLEHIKEFVRSEDKSKTLVLKNDDDKEHRKLVHKYIKDTFKDIGDSGTFTFRKFSSSLIMFFY